MTPDKVQARKMVLAGLLVLTLVTVYKDRRKSTPAGSFRTFWGVGVVGMFLSLLADFLPQIAGPFAMLIALGSLSNGGEQLIEKALGVISPQATSTTAPGSSSPPGQGSSPGPPPTKTVTHTTVVGP